MPHHFMPDADIPDLKSRVIVITGGNAGLGAECTRRLVKHSPRRIYLCARVSSKGEALVADIRDQSPDADIEVVHLDLASFRSIEAASEHILSSTDRLDVLLLNAGISATAPNLTREGYEEQFGVNHLGHAYFTQLLSPLLLRTARFGQDVRIVTVASEAAGRFAPEPGLVLQDVKTKMSGYSTMARYGHSKLANILFTKKLAQVYSSITCVSVHPGFVNTEIQSKATGANFMLRGLISILSLLVGVNAMEGAKTQLWASTAKGVKSGSHYKPIGNESQGSKYANDQLMLDKLWEWTNDELRRHSAKGWAPSTGK